MSASCWQRGCASNSKSAFPCDSFREQVGLSGASFGWPSGPGLVQCIFPGRQVPLLPSFPKFAKIGFLGGRSAQRKHGGCCRGPCCPSAANPTSLGLQNASRGRVTSFAALSPTRRSGERLQNQPAFQGHERFLGRTHASRLKQEGAERAPSWPRSALSDHANRSAGAEEKRGPKAGGGYVPLSKRFKKVPSEEGPFAPLRDEQFNLHAASAFPPVWSERSDLAHSVTRKGENFRNVSAVESEAADRRASHHRASTSRQLADGSAPLQNHDPQTAPGTSQTSGAFCRTQFQTHQTENLRRRNLQTTNPQPPVVQSFLKEVHNDLWGSDTSLLMDEPAGGPVFERDAEWEASVFLWKKRAPGPREVGSTFPGTPGPAFLGDDRRYVVEDTGKQLRIKRLGKRDKQGPIRGEREHRRELERRWLEENYGVTLPPSKGVKSVVNRIGGWKVLGQGWVERRRDTEIKRIAKSVGMNRELERATRETGVSGDGLRENEILGDMRSEETVGTSSQLERARQEVRFSEDGVMADAEEEQHAEARLDWLPERARWERVVNEDAFKQTEVWESEGAASRDAGDRAQQKALKAEKRAQQRLLEAKERARQRGLERATLRTEGTVAEVERFARRAFLEHLETKYGKLHVGRLWRQTKIEEHSGWLQVYHDTVLPGHGVVALEVFPESAPPLQDAPPPKYKRPHPVSTKMRKRLDSMPKVFTRPPPPEDPPGSVYLRGRPVRFGSVDQPKFGKGGKAREALLDRVGGLAGGRSKGISECDRASKREETLSGGILVGSAKGLKDKEGADKAPPLPQAAHLGLKVLERRFRRAKRLRKLKVRSDWETGWFEKRILAAARSRVGFVVDRRGGEPVSEGEVLELEAVDSVGLVVRWRDDIVDGASAKSDTYSEDEVRQQEAMGQIDEQEQGFRHVNTSDVAKPQLSSSGPLPAAVLASGDVRTRGLLSSDNPRSHPLSSDDVSSDEALPLHDVTGTEALSLTDVPSNEACSLGTGQHSFSGWSQPATSVQSSNEERRSETVLSSALLHAKDQLSRTFRLCALRVPEQEAERLALRLDSHLLHWPRISNTWADPASANPATSPSADVQRPARFDADAKDVFTLVASDDQSPSDSDVRNLVGRQLTPREQREASLRRLASESMQRPNAATKVGPNVVQGGPSIQTALKEGVNLKALGAIDLESHLGELGASAAVSSSDWLESLQPLLSRSGSPATESDALLTNQKAPPGAPTRLLLLDESLAGRPISYLPRALRVLLGTCSAEGGLEAVEGAALVACELTIGYEYWTADEALSYLVSSGGGAKVEFVGHVAVLYEGGVNLDRKGMIGQVLVDKSRYVRTVIAHPDSPLGRPELLAGEPSYFTTTAENGVKLELDFGAVSFDATLAAERQRLLDTFSSDDVVCDTCAGIGALAVAAAQCVRFVHANDPNPAALCYLARNAELNGTQRNMRVWNLEPQEFVREIEGANPRCFVTQFVLDLTRHPCEVLAAFRGSFDRGLWGEDRPLPHVHVYTLATSNDPEDEITEQIRSALGVQPQQMHFHPIGASTSSGSIFATSFQLPYQCAFDDTLGYD